MKNYPRTLVCVGIGIQVFCNTFEAAGGWLQFLTPLGMAVSGVGLYAFHKSKSHSNRYVIFGTTSAVVPFVGPVIGLILKPPKPTQDSRPTSYASWGFFMVGCALLWAICPAYEAQAFALGSLFAAGFSFAAWGADHFNRPRMALLLFISSFGGCVVGAGLGAVINPSLIRKSNAGATKDNLGAIRTALSIYYEDSQGMYPAGLESLTISGESMRQMPPARVYPHHSDSSAVIIGKTSTDMGGWLYNNDTTDDGFGSLQVNCTHTDTRSIVWSSY
ncbi:MAG: hypothetical protein ABIJ96_15655 [Elusimicrobiota bacterium]